jgi:hypothetical protein
MFAVVIGVVTDSSARAKKKGRFFASEEEHASRRLIMFKP